MATASATAATAPDVSREPTISSWKDDPSERARRIWTWWRSRLQAKSILPSFRKAARLVVLVPPSSAAAERAFSQLKLILEAIGPQTERRFFKRNIYVIYFQFPKGVQRGV